MLNVLSDSSSVRRVLISQREEKEGRFGKPDVFAEYGMEKSLMWH